MSRNKTHQGVEMRNTLGMKSEPKGKTWVITINRTQAKVFDWEPDGKKLELVKVWSFPEGKLKGTELVSDQPGRVFDAKTFSRGGHQTATPRHSYGRKTNPKELLAMKNTKLVVDWVEKNKNRLKVTELVCVAEPRVMGMVQKQMQKKYRDRLQKKWEKDFNWLNEEALEMRLIGYLTGKAKEPMRLLPRLRGAFGIPPKGQPKTPEKRTKNESQYGT